MSKSRMSYDPQRDDADRRAKKFRENIPNPEGKPGGLYALYPRETIIDNMRKLDGAERVYWGWVRYSWCYPISLSYAVEVDADENPIWEKHTGRFMPLSQKRLATIMGVAQSHVCRDTGELVDQGRLRVEDGATYVAFTVEAPEIPPNEGYTSTGIWGIPLSDVPTLPKPVLHTLQRIFEEAQVPLGQRRLELAQPFFEIRRDLLDTWNQIRETEALNYAQNLARLREEFGLQSNGNGHNGNGHNGTATGQRQDSKGTVKDTAVRNEELYDAGMGKGALAKLPSPRNAEVELDKDLSLANELLLGLGNRELVVELLFAQRLMYEMTPCDSAEFFFQVLDNDRESKARQHKRFTTTLLPSVAKSVALKYRDKTEAERLDKQRVDIVNRQQQARRVAEWKDGYLTAHSPEDRQLYAELVTAAGEELPQLPSKGAGA